MLHWQIISYKIDSLRKTSPYLVKYIQSNQNISWQFLQTDFQMIQPTSVSWKKSFDTHLHSNIHKNPGDTQLQYDTLTQYSKNDHNFYSHKLCLHLDSYKIVEE